MLITFILIYSLGETMLSAIFLLAFVIFVFVFVFKDKIGGGKVVCKRGVTRALHTP